MVLSFVGFYIGLMWSIKVYLTLFETIFVVLVIVDVDAFVNILVAVLPVVGDLFISCCHMRLLEATVIVQLGLGQSLTLKSLSTTTTHHQKLSRRLRFDTKASLRPMY